MGANEDFLNPATVPEPARSSLRNGPAPLAGDELIGGRRLLWSDVRVANALLNEARYRALARVFGISRADSSVVTLIVIGLGAGAVRRTVIRAIQAPGPPALGDAAIGAAVLRDAAQAVTGPWPKVSPVGGALIVTAFVGAAIRPVAKGTWRGLTASSRRAHADFDHRYGHILRRAAPRRA